MPYHTGILKHVQDVHFGYYLAMKLLMALAVIPAFLAFPEFEVCNQKTVRSTKACERYSRLTKEFLVVDWRGSF